MEDFSHYGLNATAMELTICFFCSTRSSLLATLVVPVGLPLEERGGISLQSNMIFSVAGEFLADHGVVHPFVGISHGIESCY